MEVDILRKFLFLLILVFLVVIVLKERNGDPLMSVNKDINTHQDSYQAQGYVVFKDKKVYFIDEKEIKDSNIIGYLEQSSREEHPSASILSFNDSDAVKFLKTGDKIQIWVSELLESYPGRYTVTKYEKIGG